MSIFKGVLCTKKCYVAGGFTSFAPIFICPLAAARNGICAQKCQWSAAPDLTPIWIHSDFCKPRRQQTQQTWALNKVFLSLLFSANMAQQNRHTDIPFAMDELLKIENGLVKRKLEAIKVQKKNYRFMVKDKNSNHTFQKLTVKS